MRVTDGDDTDGRDGRRLATALDAGGLLVERMPTGVGRDEYTTVVDLHERALAGDLDGLTGEPRARALSVTVGRTRLCPWRPGTGAACRNCQQATGATMSTMNRVRTRCQRRRKDHEGTQFSDETGLSV